MMEMKKKKKHYSSKAKEKYSSAEYREDIKCAEAQAKMFLSRCEERIGKGGYIQVAH